MNWHNDFNWKFPSIFALSFFKEPLCAIQCCKIGLKIAQCHVEDSSSFPGYSFVILVQHSSNGQQPLQENSSCELQLEKEAVSKKNSNFYSQMNKTGTVVSYSALL